jgi:hypothetical protein
MKTEEDPDASNFDEINFDESDVERLTMSELAAEYKVDKKTMRRWLAPIMKELGKRIGHTWSKVQMIKIRRFLGPPVLLVGACYALWEWLNPARNKQSTTQPISDAHNDDQSTSGYENDPASSSDDHHSHNGADTGFELSGNSIAMTIASIVLMGLCMLRIIKSDHLTVIRVQLVMLGFQIIGVSISAATMWYIIVRAIS